MDRFFPDPGGGETAERPARRRCPARRWTVSTSGLAGSTAPVLTLPEVRGRRGFPGVLPWTHLARCRGRTHLFFPQLRERPERRARREAEARSLCAVCPVLESCQRWARENREYGFWGGESEEERAAAGYRAAISAGAADQIEWEAPEQERQAV